MWPFTHHVRIPGGPLFPAWEETTLCPWSWLQGLGGFIQQPVFVQRREQRATLSRSWPLLLGLHWPPWTGSLGLRPPPLTPVAKVRPSSVPQSSAHAPRGLQPHDASGLGKGRARRLQGAEKPSRGPGSSWGGRDAGGLGPRQVQLLEEGAQRRHKGACVPAPAQRQALFLKKLPVWEPSFSLQTARV